MQRVVSTRTPQNSGGSVCSAACGLATRQAGPGDSNRLQEVVVDSSSSPPWTTADRCGRSRSSGWPPRPCRSRGTPSTSDGSTTLALSVSSAVETGWRGDRRHSSAAPPPRRPPGDTHCSRSRSPRSTPRGACAAARPRSRGGSPRTRTRDPRHVASGGTRPRRWPRQTAVSPAGAGAAAGGAGSAEATTSSTAATPPRPTRTGPNARLEMSWMSLDALSGGWHAGGRNACHASSTVSFSSVGGSPDSPADRRSTSSLSTCRYASTSSWYQSTASAPICSRLRSALRSSGSTQQIQPAS